MTNTSGCLGKIGYASRKDAEIARKHFIKHRGVHTDPLSVYHCANCAKFHMGRDKRRGNKAVKRSTIGNLNSLAKLRRYLELTRTTDA